LDEKLEEKIVIIAFFVVILFSAAFGFANTLSTSGIAPIGAKDDVIPALNNIEVGQIQWKKTGGNYSQVIVEIRNTDSVSHTYEICVIFPNGASLSDTAGTSADCNTSASTSSGQLKTTTVAVSIPLAGHDGTSYITLEEVS
jgi:hypothetical protein